MQGVASVISIMTTLVSQMTPVFVIDTNEVDGDNWKLEGCNTYWLSVGCEVTIGAAKFKIVSFLQNDHIVVSGAAQPVGTFFQLEAPVFQHGSHRKVSGERTPPTNLTLPLVYLPVPEVDEDYEFDSDIAYSADIKPLFLMEFDKDSADIDAQQLNVIEPTNAMADFFVELIIDQIENFNRPGSVKKKEWMDFGNETIWGNDKRIFNQRLSGVELKTVLEVIVGATCLCDNAPIVTCAPVNVIINGVQFLVVQSGDDGIIVVKDTNGVVVGSLILGEWIVPAAGGGTIDIFVNGELFYDDVSTDQDVPVVDTDENPVGSDSGGLWEILGSAITINGVPLQTLLAETNLALNIHNTEGTDIGAILNPTTVEIPDTDIEVFLNSVSQGVTSVPAGKDETINIVWT